MKKTAIVTGGAKGIGKAIVEALLEKGYHVVVNYFHSEKEAKQIKQKWNQSSHLVDIYQADVSKREEVQGLIAFSKQVMGTIDIVVNNAGIDLWKTFTQTTDEDWNQMLANNLTSAFLVTQEAIGDMIQRRQGCILNISSIWGITGASCEVAYSVSKAGLDGFTKALAKELAPSNIRVNSIAPGAIDTSMNEGLNQEDRKEVEEQIPLRKIWNTKRYCKMCYVAHRRYLYDRTGNIAKWWLGHIKYNRYGFK